MQTCEFGSGGILLVQPVGAHELSALESEAAAIRGLAGEDFRLLAVRVDSWNRDLSPWEAPAVFGDESFGDGAEETLRQILQAAGDRQQRTVLGGYSLAGLFALWAGTRTDRFDGIAAASPSVWFPGFPEYLRGHPVRAKSVYLSLGGKEEKTRNQVMSRVGDCIREVHGLLEQQGVLCSLEWNEGNHFREPDLRTAKAFAWAMRHIR